MRISVRGSRELTAVVLAVKAMDRNLKRELSAATRDTLNPIWQGAVGAHVAGSLDSKVLGVGVRVKPGNPPVLYAAASRRKLKGGLVPAQSWYAVEYGGNREKVTAYKAVFPGTRVTHQVKRHTQRQLETRDRNGRVLGPAVAATLPRLAAMWCQTVVRTVMDAFDGKG